MLKNTEAKGDSAEGDRAATISSSGLSEKDSVLIEPESEKEEPLHPEESVTALFLIRHGHTQATEKGLLYTEPAAELTERGRDQAVAVAKWMSTQSVDALLCGDAKRVIDTADIIARQLALEKTICPGLEEWNVGKWEGRSYSDIKKNEPEVFRQWSQDPIANSPPEGESIVDLCQRIAVRLSTLLQDQDGRKVALVTHSGIIRAILVHALGMSAQQFWRLSIPVGSVSRVDFSSSFATVQFLSLRPAADPTMQL